MPDASSEESLAFQGTELIEALRDMVGGWIVEGFTEPPYTDAQYTIFERLSLDCDGAYPYDTRRPSGGPAGKDGRFPA